MQVAPELLLVFGVDQLQHALVHHVSLKLQGQMFSRRPEGVRSILLALKLSQKKSVAAHFTQIVEMEPKLHCDPA